MMTLGIIFPVYNEEARLEQGICRTQKYIEKKISADCHIYIVDNASTDRTGEIAGRLEKKYENVCYYRIEEKGAGAAFRKGVEVSADDIVGYMDIDLATDISSLKMVEQIFTSRKGYEIVNASRFQRKSKVYGRKWYRNITSYVLIILLKTVLKMKASDAICGFKFFRRDTALALVRKSSMENGWFFLIELLLRAEREGRKIYELSVRWKDDAEHSKVKVIEVIRSYLIGISKLYREFAGK